MTKKQVIWIIGLNIASYVIVKTIEKIIEVSPFFTEIFLKYFDVNLYYALFVALLNIAILAVILRRHKKSIPLDSTKDIEVSRTTNLIFLDNYDFYNWEKYRDGMVSRTTELFYSRGACLRKHHSNDPDGGYKFIGETITPGFLFSGWIYGPSNRAKDGIADRLAIEDKNNNGYGFIVAHFNDWVGIERRDNGNGTTIGEPKKHKPPSDQWYHFMFFLKERGEINFYLYSLNGTPLVSVKAKDSKYTEFDRIAVHGGYPYYIDDLKIISI